MSESDSVPTWPITSDPPWFGFLESFELSQVVDPKHWSGLTLVLRLRSSGKPGSPCHRLEFQQVQELRLSLMPGLYFYGVEIRSIREMQLENRNYYVIENDNDALSFYCHSFSSTLEST